MNNIETTINRAIARGENVAYITDWIDDANEKQLRDNGFIVHMQDYGRITRIEWQKFFSSHKLLYFLPYPKTYIIEI